MSVGLPRLRVLHNTTPLCMDLKLCRKPDRHDAAASAVVESEGCFAPRLSGTFGRMYLTATVWIGISPILAWAYRVEEDWRGACGRSAGWAYVKFTNSAGL